MPHILGSRRGRRYVGDDFRCQGRSGTKQQDSIGKTYGGYQGDAGEVHGDSLC
jgi:hypothetical protein